MLLTASLWVAMQMARSHSGLILANGAVLSKNCTVAAREYRMPTAEGTAHAGAEEIPTFSPAVTIRGNNVTVDFNGAVLRGTDATAEPDERKGLAVLVQGKNVTIKNLHVHGYKVGLMAKGCIGLRILNSNFSYNWKQRLKSTLDKEDESDWQSYHHNDHNEWLRYGAGIYLDGCSNFVVSGSKTHGGQCGLMLVRSHSGTVVGNNFSFMSGMGIGLYDSRANSVLYNKVDWCVRGFSYGVYNRGQDSAGILVFEKCDNNLFAYNSVTHGGDGFFLWAGQTMMDTGKGGCNGNVVYGNDFSHSPCNAIEATFSSNAFVNNKLVECWHGVWGGYSFDTKIAKNVFAFNGEGISIEHGQNNSITDNLFFRENTAINLWQDPITDPNWNYPKHHDTVSRDYQIEGNTFDRSSGPAISVRDTRNVLVGGNRFVGCASALKENGIVTGSRFDLGNVEPGEPPSKTMTPGGRPLPGVSDNVEEYLRRFNVAWNPFGAADELKKLTAQLSTVRAELPRYPGTDRHDVFLKAGALRGQRYILVDRWGPYDFLSPVLWPREILTGAPAGLTRRRFEVLGPPGHWRLLAKAGGISTAHASGPVPGFVDLDLPTTKDAQTSIELEYVGQATTDYRGIVTPAGKPVKFGYR